MDQIRKIVVAEDLRKVVVEADPRGAVLDVVKDVSALPPSTHRDRAMSLLSDALVKAAAGDLASAASAVRSARVHAAAAARKGG